MELPKPRTTTRTRHQQTKRCPRQHSPNWHVRSSETTTSESSSSSATALPSTPTPMR
nr:MAG TPA: hypothetical protein [Bacteriophage sp.]